MPEISRFYGIRITMQYGDHNPPHFHAHYSGKRGSILINTLEIYEGNLPSSAQKLIKEWAEIHQRELLENWKRTKEGSPLIPVQPLE